MLKQVSLFYDAAEGTLRLMQRSLLHPSQYSADSVRRKGRETALTSYYQSTRDEAKYPPSKSSFEQCLLLLFLEWVLLQKQHESHNLTRPPRSTANGILGAVRKTRGKQKYSARLIQRSS